MNIMVKKHFELLQRELAVLRFFHVQYLIFDLQQKLQQINTGK
jgi:hypothetical protein